jgi:chitinase
MPLTQIVISTVLGLCRSVQPSRESQICKSRPPRDPLDNFFCRIEDSIRVPLRDAVEKRPPPDEPDDVDDFELDNNEYQFYYYPPRVSLYTPIQYFRDLISEQYVSVPYRIDNVSQQLIRYPARGRSLFGDNPFLRGRHSEIVETVYDPREEQDRVVCYVQAAATYRKEPLSFSPEDLDPYACTHVIYAFASIDPHTFNMISNDDEFDIIQGGYRSVTGLKRLNPKLKVLISVGEGRQDGSHRFSSMVSSANRRREFIRSAIGLIKQYNFDGMDIHWEYPGAEELGGQLSDKEYLNLFLEELSEIFKPRGWLLSIAVPASRFRVEDGFNPQRLGSLVDFVNLQAFDFHRERDPVADHHSNLYPRPHDNGLDLFLSVDYAVKFWIKKGLPKSKIIVGIPFFGRSFTLQYSNETQEGAAIKGPGREGFYTQNPGYLAYFEICDMLLNEGWHKGVDEAGAPYMVYGDQWVGYDDAESVERKVRVWS